MRRITFTLLTLIIGGQAAWSRDAVTAQDQTPLNFGIKLNRYYDGLYTSAPDDSVRHVFFVGEPIDVVVDVGNAGDEEESLDTSTVPMRDAFSIDARQGFNRGMARVELSPTGEVISAENQRPSTGETSFGSVRCLAWSGKASSWGHLPPAFTNGRLTYEESDHRSR